MRVKYKTTKCGVKSKEYKKKKKPSWILQAGQNVENVRKSALNDILDGVAANEKAIIKGTPLFLFKSFFRN